LAINDGNTVPHGGIASRIVLGGCAMKKLWLFVSAATMVVAILVSPSSTFAQKGKGGRLLPLPGNKGDRDKDDKHKGNKDGDDKHKGDRDRDDKRKDGDDKHKEDRDRDDKHKGDKDRGRDDRDRGDKKEPARGFAHPKTGNTLPQDIRDKLPPGLRDMPNDHSGLANHLRKMGVLKDYPAIDPVPAQVRNQLPPGMRDLPYDHPGVANHLGKLGWTINHDGLLIPPSSAAPAAPSAAAEQPLQPFGGIFRRR
jgi:hypothetical protein